MAVSAPITLGDLPDHAWIDRAEYPFASHFFETPHGRMHYLDEGHGPPLVLVHGTPTWSFMYRHLVKRLSHRYQCIAPDNLGFGLSSRPNPHTLRIADHAAQLQALIDHLGLRDITLVVHDFGGPIGLSYALERPDNVRALVLVNTWLWSLQEYPAQRRGLQFAGGSVGRWLYRRFNFSPRVMLKTAWGDQATLTPTVHAHYVNAFPTPDSRAATVQFAREGLAAGAWLDEQWSKCERLRSTPALLVWGKKDPSFGGMLPRWQELFPEARVVAFDDVGHVPLEERPGAAGAAIEAFLGEVDGRG